MDIKSYKNIIFDLGGVIIDIDPLKAVEAFASYVYKAGNGDVKQLYEKIVNGTLLMDYEKGNINDEEFRNALNDRLDINLTNEKFDEAFNALLLDYTPERLQLLTELKKSHNIYLLSNTCHIHFEYYNNLLKEKYGYSDLKDLFDQAFVSFEMGLRKPDTKIYKTVLEQANLKAEESIFIDDSLQNVEAAEMVGIKGYHKPQEVDLVTIFE
jgi:epoxide hydrolase-like predicted phosphatase